MEKKDFITADFIAKKFPQPLGKPLFSSSS